MSNETNNAKNVDNETAVKVGFFERVKGAFAAFYANKKLFITVIVCVAVLLAVGVGVLITVLNDETRGDTPNTGEILEGSYYMGTSVDAFSGSSVYTFDGNKVTNTYTVGAETTTVEYRYVIAIEKGEKVIKLTHTPEGGTPVTTTHAFINDSSITTADGTFEIIFINGVQYTKKNPAE